MQLYNTLTRQIEDLKPLNPPEVSLYTCGPTVYDYYHIGNLRNAIFNDTLKRVVDAAGYQVKHVMNITDVGHLVSDSDEGEDKLQKGALREGKTVWEVAEHYTEAFKKDMASLNVLTPNSYKSKKYNDNYARATEFIDEQVRMVKLLIDKGFAYQTKKAIYFDVTKLKDYGVLSGQKLSEKEIAARQEVVTDADKHHPYDFAVWFFTVDRFADHSMKWDSPWGEGFPGWHLECSAIIHATLGDPIDIHTGGVDHIGTHHPNEMAQTEAAFNHKLANYWLHNEFILVDGVKMSKSKNNSFTLKDIIDKGFSPLAYRLMVLQAHYRSELNFSWENLASAESRLKNWQALADLKWQTKNTTESNIDWSIPKDFILEKLSNDLNTSEAITTLDRHADSVQILPTNNLNDFVQFLEFADQVFGLDLSKRPDIGDQQKNIIEMRAKARAQKDWTKSDTLRNELIKDGVGIKDNQDGQIWFRL